MKSAFLKLFFATLLLSLGCSKDAVDPCEGVTCQNGGICVDGSCECPDGYTGFNCETEQVPKTMFIEALEVLRFPAFESNGDTWDVINSEPDLTFEIAKHDDASFYTHSKHFPDVDGNSRYIFTDLSIQLDNPSSQQYDLILFDYDSPDPNDFMGGVIFIPFTPGSGFPEKIELDPGGTVAFEITVRYTF